MKKVGAETDRDRRQRAIAAVSTAATILTPGLKALGTAVMGKAADQANNQTTDSNND